MNLKYKKLLIIILLLLLNIVNALIKDLLKSHPLYINWIYNCDSSHKIPDTYCPYTGLFYFTPPTMCLPGCGDEIGIPNYCSITGEQDNGWYGWHGCGYYVKNKIPDPDKYNHPECPIGYIADPNSDNCTLATCNGILDLWDTHTACALYGGYCIEGSCWYYCAGIWSNTSLNHPGCKVDSNFYGNCKNGECVYECGNITRHSPFMHIGCPYYGSCNSTICLYNCYGRWSTDRRSICNVFFDHLSCAANMLDYMITARKVEYGCFYTCNNKLSLEQNGHPGCSYGGSCLDEVCYCNEYFDKLAGIYPIGRYVKKMREISYFPDKGDDCYIPGCNKNTHTCGTHGICIGIDKSATTLHLCNCDLGYTGYFCDICDTSLSYYRQEDGTCKYLDIVKTCDAVNKSTIIYLFNYHSDYWNISNDNETAKCIWNNNNKEDPDCVINYKIDCLDKNDIRANCILDCIYPKTCRIQPITYNQICVCPEGFFIGQDGNCQELWSCDNIIDYETCSYWNRKKCLIDSNNRIDTYDMSITCEEIKCYGILFNDINVCSGHGLCITEGNFYGLCYCDPGWGGAKCNHPKCGNYLANKPEVCNYKNGTCLFKDGIISCICNKGWTGDNCDILDCSAFCNYNHENCTYNSISKIIECHCATGWKGIKCGTPICKQRTCSTNTHCVAPDVCICDAGGYYNTSSSTDIDVCSPICTTCDQIYGNCIAPGICECLEGTVDQLGNGSVCAVVCNPACNPETQVCKYNINKHKAQCKPKQTSPIPCLTGYYVSLLTGDCQPACDDIKHEISSNNVYCCEPNVLCCKEGYFKNSLSGKCEPYCGDDCTYPRYTCVSPNKCGCSEYWTGKDCNIPICKPKCKLEREYCFDKNGTEIPYCKCIDTSWTGVNCKTPICEKTCTVENHKKCISPNNCACIGNYYPVYENISDNTFECLRVYSCNNIPNFKYDTVCNGNGKCIAEGKCRCNHGYTNKIGRNDICEPSKCNGVIWNNPSVCSTLSHGICNPDTYKCVCNSNWTGDNCEIPKCYGVSQKDANMVCGGKKRGTCIGVNKCTCSVGWMGPMCNISVCVPLCNSKSLCVYDNITDNAVCKCKEWLTGKGCNTAYCNPPCNSNTEICTYPNTCICDISRGYFFSKKKGKCTLSPSCFGVDAKSSQVCSGHGNCISLNQCECEEFYTGETCDTLLVPKCYGISAMDKVHACSGHGNCLAKDDCRCDRFYYGKKCMDKRVPICAGISGDDPLVCDSHGSCYDKKEKVSEKNSYCECNLGYKLRNEHCVPIKCNGVPAVLTQSVCSGNGICYFSNVLQREYCECYEGWTGTDCEQPLCDGKDNYDTTVCHGYGRCIAPDLCYCTVAGHTGSFCEKTQNVPIPYPAWTCKGRDGQTSYHFLKQEACGNNGKCVGQDHCLCDNCLYYGNLCQYKYDSWARLKYCSLNKMNIAFSQEFKLYYDY